MWKVITVLAVLLVSAAIHQTYQELRRVPITVKDAPVVPQNPYRSAIYGTGFIEPQSRNVVVGVREAGLVTKVFVRIGQEVKAGDPLVQIDTSLLEQQRKVAVAALLPAEAKLQRAQKHRRPEEEPLLKAELAEAEAGVAQALSAQEEARAAIGVLEWHLQDLTDIEKRLVTPTQKMAIPEEQEVRAHFKVQGAKAELKVGFSRLKSCEANIAAAQTRSEQARANLALFQAGAWAPDVELARADLELAKAEVARLDQRMELQRVLAPLDGTILVCNMKEGEFVSPVVEKPEFAGLVMGDLRVLHARVNLDEADVPRFRKDAPVRASVYGLPGKTFPLEFVRVEPLFQPKRDLGNDPLERVDTRVLQVIYKAPENMRSALSVGQRLDVFIESP